MASSKAKSREIAEQSIVGLIRRHRDVMFVTFSEPPKEGGLLWTKDEAEKRFKPFRDWCVRQHRELLVFWERQKRGSWHPHCLVSGGRISLSWLRPWMVARGWGVQMRIDCVVIPPDVSLYGWRETHEDYYRERFKRLVLYLSKYLTKRFEDPGCVKKKLFEGTNRSKAGVVKFTWLPHLQAGSFLYQMGKELFAVMNGRSPGWRDIQAVMRVGVEVSGWANVDPWWDCSFG